MGILATKKKSNLSRMEEIKAKNESITSIFSKTVHDLQEVNLEMEELREQKTQEANALLDEALTLEQQKEVNERVMAKINEFLV